jgi:hypothetical protein
LRRSGILGENPGIPKDSEEKTGYADVESNERFPHPHASTTAARRKNRISNSGFWGVFRLLQNEKKTTLCHSHRLWLIVDEWAMKLSHSSPQQIRFARLLAISAKPARLSCFSNIGAAS